MIGLGPCEEWKGPFWSQGYGRIGDKRAHRVAWEQAHGEIPAGLMVLHHCDNPACIRLDHLYLGTHADNMADRVRRDRGVRGERVNTAKLTEKQIQEIRARCDAGEVHSKIAADYPVSQAMISQIARREAWARIPEASPRPTSEELEQRQSEKRSQARRASWDPERRARQSRLTAARNKNNQFAKGHRPTSETRAKMSEARKRWWEKKKGSA